MAVSDSIDQEGAIFLTCLSFRLNVAPIIMKAIVSIVLAQEEQTMKAMSFYIDDIYVNEEITSVDEVKAKLESFGLTCQDPERLKYGTKVLGLKNSSLHTDSMCV